MIEEGLFSFLSGNVNVSALCGDRIYPVILPQNPVYPCVTYRVEGDQRGINHNEGQESFVGDTLQIDAWGVNFSDAKNLAKVIKEELMNYNGLMGTVSVDRVFVDTPIDVYEDRVEKYRSTRNFLIWYREV